MSETLTQNEQLELDIKGIQKEREQFDFDTWKKREPYELLCNQINCIAEEQQIYRRNIETLTALRKSFGVCSGEEDKSLRTIVDVKLKEFIGGLRLTTAVASVTASNE